jgi:hypothetical protein
MVRYFEKCHGLGYLGYFGISSVVKYHGLGYFGISSVVKYHGLGYFGISMVRIFWEMSWPRILWD